MPELEVEMKKCPRCRVELYNNAPEVRVDSYPERVCFACSNYLLHEELRIVKEDNLVLKEQVRYWKWQAVSWGAPDYENFEVERT